MKSLKAFARTHHLNRAFTLIELLVVIAIIAILASLLLPPLSRAKAAAQQTKCISNMKQWSLAFKMYSDDNRDYVPEEGNTGISIFDTTGGADSKGNSDAWYNAVPPTVALKPLTNMYVGGQYPGTGVSTIFACPAAPSPKGSLGKSYAYFMYGENNWLCVNKGTRFPNPPNPGQSLQTKFTSLPKPAHTILLAEVDGNAPSALSLASCSGVSPNYAFCRHPSSTQTNNDAGRGVYALADGHAKALRLSEVRHTGDSTSANAEWYTNGVPTSWEYYWWPTPSTIQ